MRQVLTVLFVFLLVVLQTTLVQSIAVLGVAPNLLLVAAVCYAIAKDGDWQPLVFAAVCGLLFDFSSGSSLGVETLLCLLLAAGCVLVRDSLLRRSVPVAALFVLAASLLFSLLFYVLQFGIWGEGQFGFALLHKILPEAVYNTIFAFVVFPITRALAGGRRIRPGNGL